MFPGPAMSDVFNGRFGNAILFRNGVRGSRIFPYSHNLIRIKFGAAIDFAIKWFVSTFAITVRVVVGLCAKEKMVDVDACRHIATMKYVHPVGNGAVIYDPRKTVNKRWRAVNTHPAIASVQSPHPYLTAGLGNSLAVHFYECAKRLLGMLSFHDTSTKVVDVLPVSRVVARRRLQPVVPALQG